MEPRYERNIPSVSEEEQELLAHKRVIVFGCGGLGGYVLEYLARMGVGTLSAADGDVFEASNLNRQILSSPSVFGKSKAETAGERIRLINPEIQVHTISSFFTAENADELLSGQDLAVDALDTAEARLLLEEMCEKHRIPLVHGAIQGWSMQAAVIFPGDRLLHRLYGTGQASPNKTSLPFTPAFCAAVEAAEAVKVLCGRESSLAGKLLMADLSLMEWKQIRL